MTGWMAAGPSVLASFLASLVEFVEALTIVLAVGIVRGWRSALLGAAAGVILLAGLVLSFGNSLAKVPLPILQFVIGLLLLMFGLRWLRKAVLRQAGVLPLHDETEAFAKESDRMRHEGGHRMRWLDKIAFATSFKAVVLEGLEVVFIVIALGVGGRMLVPAAIGAALAFATVLVLGVWLHRPLSRVPENSLKFGVGILLSSFGTYWVVEGVGWQWPGQDLAVLYLTAVFLLVSILLVPTSRRLAGWPQRRRRRRTVAPYVHSTGPVAVATLELWGLFVDDGWLAGGTVAWCLCAWVQSARQPNEAAGHCAIFAAGVLLLVSLSIARRAIPTAR